MKYAILDGKIIDALEAVDYRKRTRKYGYIYQCPQCKEPARVHDDNKGRAHFEHKDRNKNCKESIPLR